jgi:phosphoribosylglycinamide formyltransferase-1
VKTRIAVCASGEGSNFEAIVHATRKGELSAEVAGLIVSRPGVGAITRAERLGVPVSVLTRKSFASVEEWDRTITDQLKAWDVTWVALAGYLALIGPQVLKTFPGRVINTHPALLPKFGGGGMYGQRVHEAVLRAGETQTGFTIHLVDEEYDRGKILWQEIVPVLKGDTPEVLGERVKARENQVYPRILNELVTGRITTG